MHHTTNLIMLWYPWPRQKAHGSWGMDIFVENLVTFRDSAEYGVPPRRI